jgi:uncharacterized membrane protein
VSVESQIAAWWVAFGGTHIIGSSVPVRTRLIRALGLLGFKGLYSLVALATFVPLCWVYAMNKHAGELLWRPGTGMFLAAQLIMLLAWVVLLQGLLTTSVMTTAAELGAPSSPEPRGIQRVTRHPLNSGFILFGLAHMLVNPWLGDLVFFGGFVVYGVLSAWHQDRRILAVGEEPVRRYVRATSALPFAAILAGRQSLRLPEFSVIALVLAIVLFAALRHFHNTLFGGFG